MLDLGRNYTDSAKDMLHFALVELLQDICIAYAKGFRIYALQEYRYFMGNFNNAIYMYKT